MALQSSTAFVPMREMQKRSHRRLFASFLDELRQGPVGVVESHLEPSGESKRRSGRQGWRVLGAAPPFLQSCPVPRLPSSAARTGPSPI